MAHRPFDRKDRFYLKAKKEGYPARSAYKIIELDERFRIFKPGRRIVDLGCAPGGWMKVAQERLGSKGRLAGIDFLPVKFTLNANSHFIQGDFLDPLHQQNLMEFLGGPADWVISDMSPNLSGVKFRDEFQSYELALKALDFTARSLRSGGGFLLKTFPGAETRDLRLELKKHFAKIKTVVPEATRQSSTEIYIVATEFRG